jgi:hypothetical protein
MFPKTTGGPRAVEKERRTDLAAERLKAKIEHALSTSYPARDIAVEGAFVTSEKIKAILANAPRL